MKTVLNIIKTLTFALSLGISLSSCLHNEYEDKEKQELSDISKYVRDNGFSEDDKLDNGIYLKFNIDNEDDSTKPKTGNTVIVEYTGKYTSGEIFETTDQEVGEIAFPDRYFVYGPIRLKMGNLMYGFDTTLRYLTTGDDVTMIIPSKFMWYDYRPVVYDVRLIAIIQNDSTYEADVFNNFKAYFNFSKDATFGPNSNNDLAYFKFNSRLNDTSSINVSINDSVQISLIAKFAELDTTSVPGDTIEGRTFFPLTSRYQKEIIYKWGNTTTFPITSIVDSAIKIMNIGDVIEVCGPASWGYGDIGFSDPYHNIIAVPPRTPVHYRIQLLGHRKDNKWFYGD